MSKTFLKSAINSFNTHYPASSSTITTDAQWIILRDYKNFTPEDFLFDDLRETSAYFLLFMAAIQGEI